MPTNLITVETIQDKIYSIRNHKVMLDSDLAELYEVETKNLNKAVKRNIDRFPEDFMFQLTDEEWKTLRFQNGTSNESKGGRRFNPYVFTEHGVAMLSSVLNSKRAIKINIQIIRVFVEMKKVILSSEEISKKITIIETLLIKHENDLKKHNNLIGEILNLLTTSNSENKDSIGFKID